MTALNLTNDFYAQVVYNKPQNGIASLNIRAIVGISS